MESRSEEFARVKKYAVIGGRGTVVEASLAEVITDTDGIGRIYQASIKPNKEWYAASGLKPITDLWIVAFENTQGEFDGSPAALCGYPKTSFPLPMDAYICYRNTIE